MPSNSLQCKISLNPYDFFPDRTVFGILSVKIIFFCSLWSAIVFYCCLLTWGLGRIHWSQNWKSYFVFVISLWLRLHSKVWKFHYFAHAGASNDKVRMFKDQFQWPPILKMESCIMTLVICHILFAYSFISNDIASHFSFLPSNCCFPIEGHNYIRW